MIRYFISLCFFCWTVIAVQGQSIQVNAHFDSTAIIIGDQVKLHIKLEHQKDVRVRFPLWADTLTRNIEIIAVNPVDSGRTANGMLHYTQDIVVTSFDTGRHVVPPIRFPFIADGYSDTIVTRPVFLDVFTIPMDSAKNITDIKPVYKVPIVWADIWPWLLLLGLFILAAALIGFIIYAIIRHKNNQPIFGSLKPMEPPHIIALRELDKLHSEKPWQNNKFKEYYTRLSMIVRTYIEGRFGVAAVEMTREEILDGLSDVGFEDNNLVERLRKLFTLADMVKFAKAEPLPNESETSLLDSYLFVNNTKVEVTSLTVEPVKNASRKKKVKIVNRGNLTAAEMLDDIAKGGRFVNYTYCISIIVMTFRIPSAIHYIKSGRSPILYGWPFLLISLIFGWWGIPWGPVYTIQAIYRAFKGCDVTDMVTAVLSGIKDEQSVPDITVSLPVETNQGPKNGNSEPNT